MKRQRLIGVACALGVAFGGVALPAIGAETPRIGAPAPEFAVEDEQGVVHRLSDYRGKVVVLEWTNPGCPYVKRHYSADTMKKLSSAFGGDVVWLAVNSTRDAGPSDTRAWKAAQGFSYPTLQDPDGSLGHLYGARTTPNMYVIDAAGMLRYSGAIDDDPRGRSEAPANHVRSAIHALLADRDPDPSETRPYGCSVKYR